MKLCIQEDLSLEFGTIVNNDNENTTCTRMLKMNYQRAVHSLGTIIITGD